MTQCDSPCPQTLHYNHIGLLSTGLLRGTVTAKAGWSLVKDIKRAPPGTNISREKLQQKKKKKRGRKEGEKWNGVFVKLKHIYVEWEAIKNSKCYLPQWLKWTICVNMRAVMSSLEYNCIVMHLLIALKVLQDEIYEFRNGISLSRYSGLLPLTGIWGQAHRWMWVCVVVCLCVSPVMAWRLVQGLPCLHLMSAGISSSTPHHLFGD